VWKEVHRSNMAKLEGGVRKREDGKILKPEGWTPPDVEGVMYGRD
jgi:predicted HAD superfamily Cof-like phosphohydrolase